MLVGVGACFAEAQGVTTASDSSGPGGSASTDAEGSSSSLTAGATASESSGGLADDSTTAAACEGAVLAHEAEPVPTQLIVLALPDIDPSAFNLAIAQPDLQAIVDTERTRVVLLDLGVGLTSFASACEGCSAGDCQQVVHRMLDAVAPALTALQDAPEYSCVLWPEEDAPRKRLLVLSPDDAPSAGLSSTITGLVDGGWDVDLACPGCGDATEGSLAPVLRAAGGIISDLSSPDFMQAALTLAIAAPPTCAWLAEDPLPPPLTTADLRVRIDPCAADGPSCPLEFAQVEGLADCDANDPDSNEFYVLENAVSEGVSLLSLCDPACTLVRRAVAFTTSIEHDYVCP